MAAIQRPNWSYDFDEGNLVSNMLAVASHQDTYEIVSVDSFDAEGNITFGVSTVDTGESLAVDLPVVKVDDWLVVRVGSRRDTGQHVCIVGSVPAIPELPTLAVQDDNLPKSGELPNGLHQHLRIEIPMGDAT